MTALLWFLCAAAQDSTEREAASVPAPPPTTEPAPERKGAFRGLNSSGTEEFRLRYWRLDDRLPDFEDRHILDYVEVVNHLDVALGTEHVTLKVRGDAVALFGNRYILDGELYHERPLYSSDVNFPLEDAYADLEKITLTLRAKPGVVDIGDMYGAFGRGIALNLVKNTDIDVDSSLRGVKGVLHAGRWDVTVLSGVTNPQQVAVENRNIAIKPDLHHAVTGARVDGYGLGPANIGAHGVMYQFARGWGDGENPLFAWSHPVDAAVAGASVELVGLAGIDWFAEADYLRYLTADIPVASGYEAYVSASGYPGRTTVLVEGKIQRDTEYLNTFAALNAYEVVTGPSLEYERAINEDSSAALNSNDLYGGRIKVDLRLGGQRDDTEVTLTPSLAQGVFRDEELGGLHFNATPETISHTVASVLYIRHEVHLLANAGFRIDQRDHENGQAFGADRMVHADVALSVPLAGKVSVELAPTFTRFWWGDNDQQQADYNDFSNALAVKVGSPFVFILYTDYSDNPLINSTGNLLEHTYGAVEAQWKPGPATTLKVFYGAYRAGIRCAGGQCRSLPGFNGAKLGYTSTF